MSDPGASPSRTLASPFPTSNCVKTMADAQLVMGSCGANRPWHSSTAILLREELEPGRSEWTMLNWTCKAMVHVKKLALVERRPKVQALITSLSKYRSTRQASPGQHVSTKLLYPYLFVVVEVTEHSIDSGCAHGEGRIFLESPANGGKEGWGVGCGLQCGVGGLVLRMP